MLLLEVGGIPEAEGAAEAEEEEAADEAEVEGVSRALDRNAIAPSYSSGLAFVVVVVAVNCRNRAAAIEVVVVASFMLAGLCEGKRRMSREVVRSKVSGECIKLTFYIIYI